MSGDSQALKSKESFEQKSQKLLTSISSHDDSALSISSFSFGEGIGINWHTFNKLQLSKDKETCLPIRTSCVQPPSSTPLQTWFTRKCKTFTTNHTVTHHESTRINNYGKEIIEEMGTSVNLLPKPNQNVEDCSILSETLYFSVANEAETVDSENCESLYKTAICHFKENDPNCQQENFETSLYETIESIGCCVIGEKEQSHESNGHEEMTKSAGTPHAEAPQSNRQAEQNYNTNPKEINIEYRMVYSDYARRYDITTNQKRFGLRL